MRSWVPTSNPESEMSDDETKAQFESPRMRLVREAAVLQIKLIVDGLRDAVLIPVSLVAAAIGLIRGGENPDTEFREIIKLGRRSERWINLFGYHRPLVKSHVAGSMDSLIDRAEEIVREQVRKGRTTPEAEDEIKEVFEEMHKAAEGRGSVDE